MTVKMSDMLAHAEEATALLKSLSHPYRLLVLCSLSQGEKSVGDIQIELDAQQVPLSQQLMRLRSEGLVATRKEGLQVFYRIARPEILEILQALQSVLCHPVQHGKTSHMKKDETQ